MKKFLKNTVLRSIRDQLPIPMPVLTKNMRISHYNQQSLRSCDSNVKPLKNEILKSVLNV